MRLTARQAGKSRGAMATMPAFNTAEGASIPSAVGGWDAYSPISAMPPENAVELINWFPQPGWIELRKGFVDHSDTLLGDPIETLMAYQGATVASNKLFAATDTRIFDVTTATAASVVSGQTNARWQHTQFAGSGGHYLWACNGEDTPLFYDGSSWAAAVITGVTSSDMIHCTIYRNRIWTVLKNSTKAAYLPLDSVQGAATTFELGGYFKMGGYLNAIGAWSTDAAGGTNEFICFISSYGEVAIFLIYDPGASDSFSFRGVATLGSPLGRRCFTRVGSDLAALTQDGVLPLSQTVSYDQAALMSQSLTKNIRLAMSQAATDYKSQFGWQMLSYPRSNMAILNVPISEGAVQQQYVMNTINGSWCRFTGQNANCWELFDNRAYFGGNDGVVRMADEGRGDENQTLTADLQGAYNYFKLRGMNKRWTTLRPLVTKDSAFQLTLQIGISVDFQLNEALDDVLVDGYDGIATWDDPDTIWDEAVWPGVTTTARWVAVSGLGYCAAVRLKVSVEWDAGQNAAQTLKISSFDVLFDAGGFI